MKGTYLNIFLKAKQRRSLKDKKIFRLFDKDNSLQRKQKRNA